jgi:hypothetical protein
MSWRTCKALGRWTPRRKNKEEEFLHPRLDVICDLPQDTLLIKI